MPEKVSATVLLIDDDEDVLASLSLYLKLHMDQVLTCASPQDINELFSKHDIQLVLLDMNFRKGVNDGKEGIYWLHHIKEVKPDAAVVLMTAYGSIDLAVESLKQGASDFLVKPWNNQKLLSTLLRALELSRSRQKLQKLESENRQLSQQHTTQPIVKSNSPAMKEIMSMAKKVASTDANVLITGENGTGKEVMARFIHENSNRFNRNFIALDLGSVNENLFEAELFGYKRGAFTDAKEEKAGRLQLAEGGTLFLDEIGNIPLNLQAKLLTAIQNKSITPLGGTKSVNIDCRILCATNMDLEKAVSEGGFRQDLLFRINTIELHIPPLRERTEDIPQLAQYFLDQFNRKYQKSVSLMPDGSEALVNYHWPGNIRELQHVIERSLILTEDGYISPPDLRLVPSVKDQGQNLHLEEIERKHIEKVLHRFEGNISQAAKALNINRNTLYRKIEKYGL